jgi:uracil-DNA glycosylase
MLPPIPPAWQPLLQAELDKPYFQVLRELLEKEKDLLPAPEQIFTALEKTPYESARVVLLGQDPYPTPGHAHGLCFSVQPGVKHPASLVNIFKELQADLGIPIPKTGCLEKWAEQGVLLLNTVLTVKAGEPLSHRNLGWEKFTDAIIRKLNDHPRPLVFILWGAHAQKKAAFIDERRHRIVTSAHPSPLSAKNGFFGSRPFSKANELLRELGRGEIDWRL